MLVVAALVSGLVFGEEPSKDAKKRVTVVGTAAVAGAAIGAAIAKENRVKGAMIGAAVGGAAGLIIDQMNKKKDAKPQKFSEL